MCSDAFMYIWTKRQFVLDMLRLIDRQRRTRGCRAHQPHSQRCRHATRPHGGPGLTPEGYRQLFETVEPRLFGEAGLFADVVRGGAARSDAARRRPGPQEDRSGADRMLPAASPASGAYPLQSTGPGRARGEFHVNPLYVPLEAPAVASGGADANVSASIPRGRLRTATAPAANISPTTSPAVSRDALHALETGHVPISCSTGPPARHRGSAKTLLLKLRAIT